MIACGATFGTAIRISLIVGSLLTLVNQGGVLASGERGTAVLLRVLANYVIPYTVSSIGYLMPFRMDRSNATTSVSDRSRASSAHDAGPEPGAGTHVCEGER